MPDNRQPPGVLVFLCLLFPLQLSAQSTDKDEIWRLLNNLVGRWEGSIDGPLGSGGGIREYEFVLEGNFLMWRHASVRLPQEKVPAGDHHREIGFFSFDPERNKLVARSFIVENFVNQYVCEIDRQRVTCEMERTEGENGSEWNGRLTLVIHDAFSFDETFELAPPGEALSVFFSEEWTRIPTLD